MKLVNLAQGSDAWKLWRRQGLGGSDVATILGVAPFEDATRDNLFREKVEGWERPVTFPMRRGNLKEPDARRLYQERFRCVAPPACVEHEDAPWMRVSLDGLCSNHAAVAADLVRWILELKVPNADAHTWALAGEVPEYYRPQCQWQLLTTGLDRLDYASYSENRRFAEADRLAVVPVTADAEMQALLLSEAEKFWQEVQERKAKRARMVDRVTAEFA